MMNTETENSPADDKPEVKSPPPKPTPKKPEVAPVELPAFEKSISYKMVEKFGDKIQVGFVKEDRVRIDAK